MIFSRDSQHNCTKHKGIGGKTLSIMIFSMTLCLNGIQHIDSQQNGSVKTLTIMTPRILTIQLNGIQYNDIQHNHSQYIGSQNNYTKYNDRQHIDSYHSITN
jgi:hypothetical protein